jgi:hypothetical protein
MRNNRITDQDPGANKLDPDPDAQHRFFAGLT